MHASSRRGQNRRRRVSALLALMTVILSITAAVPTPASAGPDNGLVLSDTGASDVPTTSGVILVDPATPEAIADKELDYLLFLTTPEAPNQDDLLCPEDVQDTCPPPQKPAENHLMTGVPYHLQERTYWCGPASVKQLLDHTGDTPTQSTLASHMGTTSDGTYFGNLIAEINQRRPNWRPWRGADINGATEMANKIAWDTAHNRPGILYVMLKRAFYPYYNRDHSGHFQTSAGWRRDSDGRLFGGYVDPYNEATYSSGGANTGGFRQMRIYKLVEATEGHPNAVDLIW